MCGLLGTAACFWLLPLEGDGTEAQRRDPDEPQHAAAAGAAEGAGAAAELQELLRKNPHATQEEVRDQMAPEDTRSLI